MQIADGKIVGGRHFDNEWNIGAATFVVGGPPAVQTREASSARPAETVPPPAQRAPGTFRPGQGGQRFGAAQTPLLTDAQREALRQAGNQAESAKVTERVRAAEQALKEAVLAQPCDAKVVQEKAEALAKVQADQTVLRLKFFPAIAGTLTAEQRERIQNAGPGSLPFMLSGFAGTGGGPGGGQRPGPGGRN